jgi:hypothetical protein
MDATESGSRSERWYTRLKPFITLTAGLFCILIVGGIVATAIVKTREAEMRTGCINNLKVIGLTLHDYHSVNNHFPTATVANKDLPPDRRLSWAFEMLPYLEGGVEYMIDNTQAWDSAKNCPPWRRVCTDKEKALFNEERLGDIKIFQCPANPARNRPDLPCRFDYVGIAGVGDDAANLPIIDRRAGCFGYDRVVSITDIQDGTSNTIMLAEVLDGGPFTAGGTATVRGVAEDRPYCGPGGQFGSLHSGVFFVDFADVSVRAISLEPPTLFTEDKTFKAEVTISGGEEPPLCCIAY